MRTAGMVALALAAAAAGSAVLAASVERGTMPSLGFDPHIELTSVTGPGNPAASLSYSYLVSGAARYDQDRGLAMIHWEENGDRPCEMWAGWRTVDRARAYVDGWEYGKIDICTGSGGDAKEVGFPSADHRYISAVRVCMNRDDDRIKGIQVRGRMVDDYGVFDDVDSEPREERPNCHRWARWVECPARTVATGLEVDLNAHKGFRSMRLRCQAVVTVN